MKTVAFLQNLWVKDPPRAQKFLDEHPDLREDYIARLLFFGGKTGRVLRSIFGEKCDSIVWEESTKEIGGKSNACPPPDYEHIKTVIKKHKPDVILTFGKVASNAVFKVLSDLDFPYAPNIDVKLICGPHPAARQPETISLLKAMAANYNHDPKRTID